MIVVVIVLLLQAVWHGRGVLDSINVGLKILLKEQDILMEHFLE